MVSIIKQLIVRFGIFLLIVQTAFVSCSKESLNQKVEQTTAMKLPTPVLPDADGDGVADPMPNLTGRLVEITGTKLVFEVKNTGTMDATSFTIKITPEPTTGNEMNIYVGNLSVMEIKRYEWSPPAAPKEGDAVKISIDSEFKLNELDETDNLLKARWNINKQMWSPNTY